LIAVIDVLEDDGHFLLEELRRVGARQPFARASSIVRESLRCPPAG
jgi:hypothetical protein